MPAWITVYLTDAVPELSPALLTKAIEPADWWTLAEDFNIEEDAASQFMDDLQWMGDPLGFGSPGDRPVQFHIWTDAKRSLQAVDEREAPPDSVSAILKNTRAIVAMEMGYSQLHTMHEIVAFEIAYWLAESFHGLIFSPQSKWHDSDKNRWQAIEN